MDTGDPLSLNLYAYCCNNPVMYVDPSGHFWDVVFDVGSLVLSVVDVWNNPNDFMAWLGVAGDIADVFIPFAGGIGEAVNGTRKGVKAAKAAKDVVETADDFADIAKAVDRATDGIRIINHLDDGADIVALAKNGDRVIDSYKELRKATKHTGLEAHHLLEKRLLKGIDIGIDADDLVAVALTHEQHAVFTKRWRAALPYGQKYSNLKDILDIAKNKVYYDAPELFEIMVRDLAKKLS